MNGSQHEDPDFSDEEGGEAHEAHPGDYSARLEELMSDMEDGDSHDGQVDDGDDDEEGGFVYSGVDAAPSGGYRAQLRDVLGPDHEDDELEEHEVEQSLLHDVDHKAHLASLMADETRVCRVLLLHDPHLSRDPQPIGPTSDETPSTPPTPPIAISSAPSPPRPSGSNGRSTPNGFSRPFLHPTISRLRSATPQASHVPSSASTLFSHAPEGASETPSHFSALSRSSSSTRLPTSGVKDKRHVTSEPHEVFRWAHLNAVGELLFSQKAASLLGTESLGFPTVMTANGLICVGTDAGTAVVFDFKQNLKCICGTEGKRTTIPLFYDSTIP